VSAEPQAVFSSTGDLPTGTLAIQASAGTGKTFALASLATRFIAERADVSAADLLIVTFTRAATSELRGRLRDQLVEVARWLGGDTETPVGNRELCKHLAAHEPDVRRRRLLTAITEFDTATITTIHGFAAQGRNLLGASSAIDLDAHLVDDLKEIVDEVCTDVLAWAAVHRTGVDLPSLDKLVDATKTAAGQPGLDIVPRPGEENVAPEQELMQSLVVRAARAITARRRRSGTLSFDDLLTDLRDALRSPGSAAALEALRSRYKVALIDEFQDTDSVQWDIFSTLFAGPDSKTVLVLVGDPKQAIYSFRGADIRAYLAAVGPRSGTVQQSLVRNWRSDQRVLDSLDTLFEGVTFGDVDIPFVPVTAAADGQGAITAGGVPLPALSVRSASGADIDRLPRNPSQIQVDSAAQAIDRDLVAHIRMLLDGSEIPTGGVMGTTRELRPSDIAVLVMTASQGESVRRALGDEGVPAVLANGGSVLQSPAARQMHYLLNAMDRPSDPQRARTFAMSWFVGWDSGHVAASLHEGASAEGLVEIQERLRNWADMLASHGIAEVFAQIWAKTGVAARVLAGPEGDRNLTDLDHLVELLNGVAVQGKAGVAGLLAALETPPDTDLDTEIDDNVVARRIESEDEAVQIMTVWLAKGLEFPVVCVPYLWRDARQSRPVVFADPDTGVRTFEVTRGGTWPDAASGKQRAAWADAEAEGERLRILYVALTRAKHHSALWWANGTTANKTALAHVLFARTDGSIDGGRFAEQTVAIPADDEMEAALEPLVRSSDGTIAVTVIDDRPAPPSRWVDPRATDGVASLDLAPFDVVLDRSARRWSFSTITDVETASIDPFDPSLADAGASDEGESSPEEAGPPGVVGDGPLAALPAGTAFGTLVHTVLEAVDFASATLEADLSAAIDAQMSWQDFDLSPVGRPNQRTEGQALLVEGLKSMLETPLGPICGGLRLIDFNRPDRLTEMSFELPLGEAGRHPSVGDISRLVLDHLAPDHPLRPWAVQLEDSRFDVGLAGHLTGSIDLVLRIRQDQGPDRFVVADYKTNQLRPRSGTVSVDPYRPIALASAMAEHDYPLQALLYSVALHRYLRWRVPGYEPQRALAGAAYLFVRGMTGPDVALSGPEPYGVFPWSLPAELVVELSDLLDGRAPAVQGVG
jgi:exodeoxyribonuclease V beta subunit